MINLAQSPERRTDTSVREMVDKQCELELKYAGIPIKRAEFMRKGEVPSAVYGEMYGWSFQRAWYYWIAEGPGIPPSLAAQFDQVHGNDCRVEGFAGGVRPLEHLHGFAVGSYHIDTQEALNAFADLLRKIVKDNENVLRIQKALSTVTYDSASNDCGSQSHGLINNHSDCL